MIARILGCAEATVRIHLRRARRKLARRHGPDAKEGHGPR